MVRPFDVQWCYYTGSRPIWNEPRPKLWAQQSKDNSFVLTRFNPVSSSEGFPFNFTRVLCDDHCISPDAVAIPFRIRQSNKNRRGNRPASGTNSTLFGEEPPKGNISPGIERYLHDIGLDGSLESAGLLWNHVLAVGYSAAYLHDHADGLRGDWPRIPLPKSPEAFIKSAELGRQVAALLDTEQQVAGITAGKIRMDLRMIARLERTDGGPIKPDVDRRLTVGWGHPDTTGRVNPGPGKTVTRPRTTKEREELQAGMDALLMSVEEGLRCLGESVVDVYATETSAWLGIPTNVWNLNIGGYQVIKKWLSYRDFSVIKRPLSLEESDEVRGMSRRLSALRLLQPALDASYRIVCAETAAWTPSTESANEFVNEVDADQDV